MIRAIPMFVKDRRVALSAGLEKRNDVFDDKVFTIEEGVFSLDEARRLFIFEGRVKKL